MYGETRPCQRQRAGRRGLSPHVRGNPGMTFDATTRQRSIPACTGKPARRARASTEPGVYPRMYGEPPFDVLRFPFQVGLSPHVRGNLFGAPGAGKSLGSIPACTGKPATSLRVSMPAAVYPRMYGETSIAMLQANGPRGLSPHVRGNLLNVSSTWVGVRSIPACTGKPAGVCAAAAGARVYPRMYGETQRMAPAKDRGMGLSPHVRGNQRVARGSKTRRGSIPACTGKPPGPRSGAVRAEVYPRMYGETYTATAAPLAMCGLSPHVRGNPPSTTAARCAVGSIPACTGKPAAHRPPVAARGVYPRMYGETTCSRCWPARRSGLSPHVRGNRPRPARSSPIQRSIPACTGKPTFTLPDRKPWRVYPRMYGETSPKPMPDDAGTGLSPHVRGNLAQKVSSVRSEGSIPACTGKPSTP